MNIEARKLLLIQEFLRIENEEIIIGLEKIVKQLKSRQYESDLEPMSVEQFMEEIDQSMKDSKEDNVIKADELRKKWI